MDSPNISDIIGLIMKNPEMLGMIKNLAAESSEKQEESPTEETFIEQAEEKIPQPQAADEPVSAKLPLHDERSLRRKHLLSALKPYVSEGRAKAIDSMLSFSEIFDVIRRG